MDEDVSTILMDFINNCKGSSASTAAAMPPPSVVDATPSGSKACKAYGGGGGDKREGKEVQMERTRREKMTEYYSSIQSIVPNLFPKAPRAKIVEETINYIRQLEGEIKSLESQKNKRTKPNNNIQAGAVPSSSSSVNMAMSGESVFFGIRAMSRPGLVVRVMHAFEMCGADVLAATVACDERKTMMMTVTVRVVGEEGMVLQRLKSEVLRVLSS
ncbi:Transcription factor bHLH71 [Acorus gramineus]|uniref:Transcription factor bHLH71 n=1 Tax=Acorus gramineus TaxID=55184 RepID=A0AAV9BL17_ACOGR|nr:Transcription factor bHLH71 [Acorus gramineus]